MTSVNQGSFKHFCGLMSKHGLKISARPHGDWKRELQRDEWGVINYLSNLIFYRLCSAGVVATETLWKPFKCLLYLYFLCFIHHDVLTER